MKSTGNSLFFPFILLAQLFLCTISAQTYLSNYTHHTVSGNAIQVFAGASSVRFMFYKSDIVRVDYLPDSTSQPDSSFVVIMDTSAGYSPTLIETDSTVEVSSTQVKIVCTKNPVRLSFYSSNNVLLLSEPQSGGLSKFGAQRRATFTLQPDEHFYGTGERGTNLDKRGLAFDSYNVAIGGYSTPLPNMAANIPFLASSKGYGLYFDNTFRGRYDLGYSSSTKFYYNAYGGELTFYLIAQNSIPELIAHYTALTGRQPMPPKWALGFIQSKYGYRDETEARTMIQTMRQKQIPCDAIILDLYWFNSMGDISWKLSAWPQPFQMMSDFLSLGIKTIVITEPYIIQYSTNYGPAAGLGYLAKNPNGQPYTLSNWWSCNCNSYLLDLTNPSAQQWWWNMHPTFFGNELAGLWTDLGEPENHPDSMKHYLGAAPKVHNIFNLLWAKTVFDGFNQIRPNQRFFNLTRSGFAGIQRYGVSIWSGDVSRTFGGLAAQLPMLLNMGISGIGYHNSDIGGFCCGTTTPELYTRWMQYGTFCPITRAHGVGQSTEPWSYDAQTEAISKKYIELRYQLLPYIYTMANENHESGMPLARPLFFDDPTDANLTNESSSYLWGNSMLVSPVVEEGQTSKSFYLPKGQWVNFWTDEKISGGQTITTPAPIETMPMFVKAGSIIPMQFVMNYTDEHPLDTLRLAVYPNPEQYGSFTMYEDDGKTLEYKSLSRAFTEFIQEISINGSDTSLRLNIGATIGTYTGKPTQRTYISEVHLLDNKPLLVRKNTSLIGEQQSYTALRQHADGYFYDSLANILYIQTITVPDSAYEIIVENVSLVGVNDLPDELPSKTFRLEQNYPNPFNPATNFGFRIADFGLVTLKIFDVLGREVATLVDEFQVSGFKSQVFDASRLSSGIYFYKLTFVGQDGISSYTDVKKMVLTR